MKKYMNIVSLILLFLTIGQPGLLYSSTKAVFMGSMQFPKEIAALPMVRIYYAGNKIRCESNPAGKRITFAIPEDKRRNIFALVITEKVHFVSEQNTIQYLKVKPGQPYKFYILELIKMQQAEESGFEHKQREPVYEWLVTEQTIPCNDGRIPDDAIILCFKPEYIDRLEGGNMVELPKVIIKNNIVSLAGSQDALDDIFNEILLSSLHTDAIHDNVAEVVCHDFKCTKIKLLT